MYHLILYRSFTSFLILNDNINFSFKLFLNSIPLGYNNYMTTHLFVRSCYTLLDSTIRIPELVSTAKKYGYQSVALTDHHVMHGVARFLHECKKEGIHPIIGLEVDVFYHEQKVPFLLLAKNNKGYTNLMKLSSMLCDGREYVTYEELIQYCEHNFLVVYGEGGYFDAELISEDRTGITQKLALMKSEFPPFDIAISYEETSLWRSKNAVLKALAKAQGIQTIALNKIYYLGQKDYETLKVLSAIKQGTTLRDKNVTPITGRYFLSIPEMEQIYDADDLRRTDEIASECHCDGNLEKTGIPEYPLKDGITAEQYLPQLCLAGLKKRLNGDLKPAYVERLKYELQVIHQMGFEDYFLIVYDFIRYGRQKGIYIGPGRGSAAGSLVAYCLGITMVDPLQYNLLFERFLNAERVSMPDIDTDIPDIHRQEIIDYVYQKYGEQHIANIITFDTLASRAVLRDVGKAMDIPKREIDMIVGLIPQTPKITLKKAYEQKEKLRVLLNASPQLMTYFNMAKRIEGLPKNKSIHAAGIVMSGKPIEEIIPTIQMAEGMKTTQFVGNYLEERGLIKMDFLGLKNLTTIDEIVQMIHKKNPDFHILSIPLHDAKTYRLFAQADTIGVFQFESDGMRNLLRKMKPNCFEDIIAALALFRPGPKDQINVYLEGRKNPSSVVYPSKELEPILKETYGVTIYQEQVMLMAQIAAKFSLVKADILRKAISKKNEEELAGLRQEYVRGCKENGYSDETASYLFDLAEKFAGYGFNKSHAVAYGLVAYQLAYLKANYPLEFYTSILNSVIGDSTKSAIYITECRRKHISIEAPDVNRSTDIYYHNGKSIILPLSIIKDVGTLAARTILDERDKKGSFGDYFDFVARAVLRKINRTQLERLISAGALDGFDLGRATMMNTLDDAVKYAKLVQVPFGTQLSIDPQLVSKPVVVRMKDSQEELSENEKAALGFNLGEQPIVHLRQKLGITYPPLAELNSNRGLYRGFAYIQSVRQIRTRKGDLMCFLKLTDETGESDMAVMPNLYSQYGQHLVKGVYIQFYAKIQDEASFLANQIEIVRQK